MHFGGAMFFTDYSISAPELALALEERGFESMWAPEHSHIPLSRKTPFPGGGELPKPYYDAMDPFVVLAAAGEATKTIKLGTGVALLQQRDTIQTAKLVASLDQVSHGRFLFGIGGGWNQDEMEDHGTVYATRFKRVRESIEAMKANLDKRSGRIPWRVRQLRPNDRQAQTGAETSSADSCRRRLSARCAPRDPLR
jgi:alkanesulfonate monooxygenase SsuD/methylene tetrahydromethanopterin reductase-like flavin-dependent oxidoreductase (luciferase family)